MKKYPVVYSYKTANTKELQLSILSLKNLKQWDGRIFIIGDKPIVPFTYTHFPVRFERGNTRFKDEFLAYLTAAELVDGFIAMADDIFCYGEPEIILLADDYYYDIIEVYEMFCIWLQKGNIGSEHVFDALPEGIKWEERRTSSKEDSREVYKSKLPSTGLQQEASSKNAVRFTLQTLEERRETWRGKTPPRSTRNAMDKDVHGLAEHETALRQSQINELQVLWGERGNLRKEMGEFLKFLRGHGSSTRWIRDRQNKLPRELYERKLSVAISDREQNQYQKDNLGKLPWRNYKSFGILQEDWIALEKSTKEAGFILARKPYSVKNYNRGTLEDHINGRSKSDVYKRHLENTKAVLDLNGQPTLSYEIHAPFLVESDKLWNIEPHMKNSNSCWRSIYGNWFNQDSEYSPDTKHAALNKDTVIYSSNNNSFNYEEVSKWL